MKHNKATGNKMGFACLKGRAGGEVEGSLSSGQSQSLPIQGAPTYRRKWHQAGVWQVKEELGRPGARKTLYITSHHPFLGNPNLPSLGKVQNP